MKQKIAILLSLLVLVIVMAGQTTWRAVTGQVSDDLNYARRFLDDETALQYGGSDGPEAFYFALGPEIETVDDVVKSSVNHYLYWGNSRLANVLAFASNLFPSILIDLLHGLVAMVLVMVMCSLVRRDWLQRPLLVVVAACAVYWILPWSTLNASGDFLFNYLWTTMLFMLSYRLMLSRKCPLWALMFVSMISGMMHDGVMVALWISLAADVLLNHRGRRGWWSVVAMAVGLAVQFASPSLRNNLATNGSYIFALYPFLQRSLTMIPIGLCFIFACVVALGRERLGAWRFVRDNVIWFLMAIIGVVMGYRLWMMEARVAWCGYVAAMMLLLEGLNLAGAFNRQLKGGAATLATIFTAWMVYLIVWQVKLIDEYHQIVESIKEDNPHGVAYADLTFEEEVPAILRGAPFFYKSKFLTWFVTYTSITGEKGYEAVVLPRALRGTDISRWKPLPGNAGAGLRSEYLVARIDTTLSVITPREATRRRPAGKDTTELGLTRKIPYRGDTLYFYKMTDRLRIQGPVQVDFKKNVVSEGGDRNATSPAPPKRQR